MSIDLSQFHQVFFEESHEGLQIMEAGLLDLDCDNPDIDTINAIFRAAHSIKGSSGTFGFTEIAEFTHVLETLLDEVREGKRGLNPDILDLLLQSVDCLSSMLSALQNNEKFDKYQAKELVAKFNEILQSNMVKQVDSDSKKEEVNQPPEVVSNNALTTWNILFVPDLNLLRTGNEPARMLRELAKLGECTIKSDIKKLPEIGSVDPESCYISWSIILTSECDRSVIDEIFEWVIDDCEVIITETAGIFPEGQILKNERLLNQESKSNPALPETPVAQKKIEKPKSQAKENTKAAEATSIRVSIEKIDSLVNLVGELVITQSMLGQLGSEYDIGKVARLQEGLAQLEHNTRELQESVMRIRMLPISFTFSRFPRLVRDLSRQLGKKVEIKLTGEQTELDKTVMERIGDPLVHLVRNALDHGLESPQDRVAAGKPETGVIELKAFHQGGNIIIEITDDGRGLNKEKIRKKAIASGLIADQDHLSDEQVQDLMFQPGFSTADLVTDVSGRGVGMDVVRRNIQELSGSIEVNSREGQGSTFTIRLPLTLAILDGQLVQVGDQTYILPLVSIVESLQPDMKLINHVAGGCDVLRLRNEYIPIIKLFEVFNLKPESEDLADSLLVVVEVGNSKVALVVDELQGQQQVVIKSMETNYKKVEGVSGATILGDGTVSLILDVTDLIQLAGVIHQGKKGLKLISNREYAA